MDKVALINLPEFTKSVLGKLPDADGVATIVALQGNLGSGKTTFAQALAKELGVEDVVQSPTYVLMKSYPIAYKDFTRLIHIDAYRLNKPEEFHTLRPQEFLQDRHALVLVEWPERLGKELPTPDMVIQFSSEGVGEGERYIELT